MKKTDFGKLNQMLELIQTDVDALTRDERIKFQIACSVFGGVAQGGSLTLQMLIQTNHVTYNQIAQASRELWAELHGEIKELRKFIRWLQGQHTTLDLVVEFPVIHAFQWSREKGFYSVERAHQTRVPVSIYAKSSADGFGSAPTKIDEFRFGEPFVALTRAMEGLPLDRLSECPRCKKVFVQATARPKTYCSSRCRTAEGVARHRAQHRNTNKKED